MIIIYRYISHIVTYMSQMSCIFDSRMRRSRFVEWRQRLIPERCARALFWKVTADKFFTWSSRECFVSVFWRGCCQGTWQNAATTICKKNRCLTPSKDQDRFFVIDRYNSEYKKNIEKLWKTCIYWEIAASARTKELQRAMAFCSATPGLERVPHAKSC